MADEHEIERLMVLLRSSRLPLKVGPEQRSEQYRRIFVGDEDGPGETVAQWVMPVDAEIIVSAVNAAPELLSSLLAERRNAERMQQAALSQIVTLRAALREACDGWLGCWESDNNDAPPDRIAELRKLAEDS